jgi:hypothetical protein
MYNVELNHYRDYLTGIIIPVGKSLRHIGSIKTNIEATESLTGSGIGVEKAVGVAPAGQSPSACVNSR